MNRAIHLRFVLSAAALAWFASAPAPVSAAATVPTTSAPQPQFHIEGVRPRRLGEFAALLDQAAVSEDFVGLAVAVVADDRIQLLKTYGIREAGGVEPVTPDTVFRIASLSKGFAATMAGLAVEEGRISLATPISGYAPSLTLSGGAQSLLTVDHVLSHRVGLPPNAYDNLLEAGLPVDEILTRLKGVKPICKVGTCYAYQNITFNLIGEVLAAAYGESYEALLRKRLFAPLRMSTASVGLDGLSARGDWARPHSRKRIPGPAQLYTPWRPLQIDEAYYRTPAAGGINASITDMARWLLAQMGGAPGVLPAKVLDEIHAPVISTPAETRRLSSLRSRVAATQYGRGWRIYDYAGEVLINHSGAVAGYGAQIAWLPQRGAGIVVLANARSKRLFRILPTFLDIELGLTGEDWLELAEPQLAAAGAPAHAGERINAGSSNRRAHGTGR